MIGDLNWKPEKNLYGLAPGVDPNYGRPIKTMLDTHVLTAYIHKTTLILRRLSSMTEEEARDFLFMEGWGESFQHICVTDSAIDFRRDFGDRSESCISRFTRCRPQMFAWFLSKGFDLFGLIESGLAIDKATLEKQETEH